MAAGQGVSLWAGALNRQIYLGDDNFVARMLDQASPQALHSVSVPKLQRSSTRSLSDWLGLCSTREEALYQAYTESGQTMTALAAEVGLTLARVSQSIARAEQRLGTEA